MVKVNVYENYRSVDDIVFMNIHISPCTNTFTGFKRPWSAGS